MIESRKDLVRSSAPEVGSDLARVDAHMIQPHEYDDLPDLSDIDPADGVTEVAGKPIRGRPALGDKAKQAVSLRLDPETLARFKAKGPGWQTRMGALLGQNDHVLAMIRENLELIDSIELMLGFMRKGELKMVFEPIDATIARVERNVRSVTETTRGLQDQLIVE